MAENSFETWRLQIQPDQSGDEILEILKKHLDTLPPKEKETFLNDLLEAGLQGDELALEALQETATTSQQNTIAEATRQLLKQDADSAEAFKLHYFIRVLLAAPKQAYQDVLTAYFLEYPIGSWWDIPNQLYERSQSLFLKAYTRFLETRTQNDLVHFHGITRLVYVPKALKFLAKNLPPELRPLIKAFASDRSRQKWLPEETRQLLTEIARS
jgi:hypothetical protein